MNAAEPSVPVQLHSSWRGIASAVVTMALLAGLAIWALVVGGATVIGLVLAVVALAAAGIVLLDYPIASSFRPEGVVRRCPLRRELLPWSRIDMVTRTADRSGLSRRAPTGAHLGRRPGGLVAVVGRRRYLLVDQAESREECLVLRDRMGEWAPRTRWVAGLPDEDQPPTWLYRRRRHRPPVG